MVYVNMYSGNMFTVDAKINIEFEYAGLKFWMTCKSLANQVALYQIESISFSKADTVTDRLPGRRRSV